MKPDICANHGFMARCLLGVVLSAVAFCAGCVAIPVGRRTRDIEIVDERAATDSLPTYKVNLLDASPQRVKVSVLKTYRVDREITLQHVTTDRYLVLGLFPGFYYQLFMAENKSFGSTMSDWGGCLLANAWAIGFPTIFHWFSEPGKDWTPSKSDTLCLIGIDKTGRRHTTYTKQSSSHYMKTVPVGGIDLVLSVAGSDLTVTSTTGDGGEATLHLDKLALPARPLTATVRVTAADTQIQATKLVVRIASPDEAHGP